MESAAVADAIEQLFTWSRRNTPMAVSSTTFTTLDTLAAAGPMRISDLARHEGVSQPGMTTLVNRLEAAGQAERITDPTDGRATLVRITRVGRRVIDERRAARTALLAEHLERLRPEHRRALTAALPAIAALTSPSELTPTR
jgi:DNA-binding MarR family transcriptional regulator